MTAPDPRLGEIEGRLAAVTQGPWDAVPSANRKWALVLAHPGTADETELARMANDDDAWFTANAPTDVAYLLAELRKAQDALGRVEGLAAAWEARGEHDMAYSKTVPDEYIAMDLLTHGADMVESARHIRNAIKGDA